MNFNGNFDTDSVKLRNNLIASGTPRPIPTQLDDGIPQPYAAHHNFSALCLTYGTATKGSYRAEISVG